MGQTRTTTTFQIVVPARLLLELLVAAAAIVNIRINVPCLPTALSTLGSSRRVVQVTPHLVRQRHLPCVFFGGTFGHVGIRR
jgi:hypothetical protein